MFFLRIRRPPRSTLVPYTALFRSSENAGPQRRHLWRNCHLHNATNTATIRRVSGEGPVMFRRSQLISLALTTLAALVLVADRKSTRLNSSHANISYAVFCLKKKTL